MGGVGRALGRLRKAALGTGGGARPKKLLPTSAGAYSDLGTMSVGIGFIPGAAAALLAL